LFSVALRHGYGLWPPLTVIRYHTHWKYHTK